MILLYMLKLKTKEMIKKILICLLLVCSVFVSCSDEEEKPPIDLAKGKVIAVPYEDNQGVKLVMVKLNGVPMNMIYDTGCSGLHISLLELQQLAKQGRLRDSDFKGMAYSCIADGSVVEDAVVLLRSVQIAEGIELKNVEASVSLNQEAPLLLGNSVLDNVASKIEVDTESHTIKFTVK